MGIVSRGTKATSSSRPVVVRKSCQGWEVDRKTNDRWKSLAPNCKKPAKSRGDEVESKIAKVILIIRFLSIERTSRSIPHFRSR